MLSESIKSEVQNAYRQVANNMSGFRNRYTQRAFIAEIAKVLCKTDPQQKILVAEGPTGTGKTMAYLLASIPIAKALNKKLIISSATVALQTQLTEKDIPLVQENSGLEFSVELAKGRGRYLCPSLLSQQVGDITSQVDAFTSDEYLLNTMRHLLESFEDSDWDGDKDKWPTVIPDEIWSKINNDRHGCLANKCRFFRDCPYFLAKIKLETADVIVANHDLILSDLALGGGILLPKPEDSVYIFDEAHHVPEKTINHASTWISSIGTLSWLDKSENIINQIEAILIDQDTGSLFSSTTKSNKKLKTALEEALTYIQSLPEFSNCTETETTLRFQHGHIPEQLRALSKTVLTQTQQSLTYLNKIKDKINKSANDNEIPEKLAEGVLPELGINIGRFENLASLCHNLVSKDEANEPPIARWITKQDYKDHSDYRIFTSPISAENFLYHNLWQRCYAAILTSATLVSLGNFGFFQHKSGLQHVSDTEYLQLASPFNFQSNSTLWIPNMESEPQNSFAHTEEIIALLPELITEKAGTLVLFSSRKQLNDVAESLPIELRDILLIQGTLNNMTLLEKHEECIKQGNTSVIMGLASFAEGIDLPGKLCTHVIIAKLPFPVPDSPIDATEREYVETQGKNHFREIVLPQTCIRLIQAVGRLIRNETDTGKVTILDRRLVSKFYGKQLLNSLPPMKRIIESSDSLSTSENNAEV